METRQNESTFSYFFLELIFDNIHFYILNRKATFTCFNSTMETPEQRVQYVQR